MISNQPTTSLGYLFACRTNFSSLRKVGAEERREKKNRFSWQPYTECFALDRRRPPSVSYRLAVHQKLDWLWMDTVVVHIHNRICICCGRLLSYVLAQRTVVSARQQHIRRARESRVSPDCCLALSHSLPLSFSLSQRPMCVCTTCLQ